MNKCSLSCVILLLVVTSRLLMADSNTNSTPEETPWFTDDINSNPNYGGSHESETSGSMEETCPPPVASCNVEQDASFCQNCTNFFAGLDPTLKVRVAGFWPTSERFTDIYGNSMPGYQIEAAGAIYACYRAWVNIDWIYKKGRSDHLKFGTVLNIGTLSFGVSLPYQFKDDFSVYAGIGPAFGYISVHNRHTGLHKNENTYAVGVVLKSGLIYNITCRYFLDVFADYLYLPTAYRTHVNLGGLKAGVGVGTHF